MTLAAATTDELYCLSTRLVPVTDYRLQSIKSSNGITLSDFLDVGAGGQTADPEYQRIQLISGALL